MYVEALKSLIQSEGPIGCVRVSSAQARGAAKKYAYWGAARYEIRVNSRGGLSYYPLERASSDRRSERLAERDADEIAAKETRYDMGKDLGSLSEARARRVWAWYHGSCPAQLDAFKAMGFPR